jgi:multicomponent Na+:H+ antiporter subunit D
LSALLGVLAALSQYELRRLLAFHSVSQVGYIVLALGLASVGGIAAAIVFALHHSLVKSALYFVADELERRNASRDLRAMDPGSLGSALLAPCFAVAAFALAGLPPFSGFFGKLAVFRAGVESERWVGLALLLVASIFTLASMLKIWRFAFQTRAGPSSSAPRAGLGEPWGLLAAAGMVLAMSLAAGPVYRYAEEAAAELVDPSVYIDAVRVVAGHPQPGEGLP